MTTDPLSLKRIFLSGPEAPSVEGEEAMAQVRQEIQAKVPAVSWSDASKVIDEKVDAILATPIDAVLAGAWAKYRELQKYADPESYPPGKTVLSSLAKHKIATLFKPSVVVRVAGMDVAALELPVALDLELEGVTLRIEGGRILKVQAGSLRAVGSLKFQLRMLRPKLPPKDLFPPIQEKTDKFEIPGAIALGDGVVIRPPQSGSRAGRSTGKPA